MKDYAYLYRALQFPLKLYMGACGGLVTFGIGLRATGEPLGGRVIAAAVLLFLVYFTAGQIIVARMPSAPENTDEILKDPNKIITNLASAALALLTYFVFFYDGLTASYQPVRSSPPESSVRGPEENTSSSGPSTKTLPSASAATKGVERPRVFVKGETFGGVRQLAEDLGIRGAEHVAPPPVPDGSQLWVQAGRRSDFDPEGTDFVPATSALSQFATVSDLEAAALRGGEMRVDGLAVHSCPSGTDNLLDDCTRGPSLTGNRKLLRVRTSGRQIWVQISS
jgi:hypothetical protein